MWRVLMFFAESLWWVCRRLESARDTLDDVAGTIYIKAYGDRVHAAFNAARKTQQPERQ